MEQDLQQACQDLADQYRTLLEVAESISIHRDLSALCRDLIERLPRLVPLNFIAVDLHDPDCDIMRLHIIQANVPADIQGGGEWPVEDTPAGWVWKMQQPLLVPDIAKETRFPKVVPLMVEDHVRSLCMVPLTTASRRLGTLGFASTEPNTYHDSDVQFLQQVGKQVAIAVENVLNSESAQSAQRQLMRERDRLRLLLEVNNAVVSHLDLRAVFMATSACLRKVIGQDYASLVLFEAETHQFRVHALDFPDGKGLIQEGRMGSVEECPAGIAHQNKKPVVFHERELRSFSSEVAQLLLAEGVKSACCIPLLSHDRALGTLNVASRQDNAFTEDDVTLLTQVANQIAIAVENALAYQQIADLKDKLNKERLYLEDEIRTEYNFEEIIGESPALKRILNQVETVAPTDSTVLILGETGTGKELIARAIHNLSGRRERTFVKINCAAIPTGLLESELFGHEKGAFTGAIAQKLGRFELAHQGTLFLDEVGDIPLELQSKLLRVLQEQEFERLGSTKTIRVNVRLVAATNRDLGQMVAEKQFRNDLYYRLNVFPVMMPPLRERPEDIALLVRYFAQKYARRMNKRIESIPTETMAALSRYHWPGNIRELENLIERSVILSHGPDLHVPLGELKAPIAAVSNGVSTLEAAERDHIMRALREVNGVIGGPAGAAARLGMKRTTLQSKMRKLGISHRN